MTTASAMLASATVSVPNSWIIAATVPAGERWIVKSAQCWPAAAGTTTVYIRCVDPVGLGIAYLASDPVASATVFQWDGWVVLHPGHQIAWLVTQQPTYIWISGARLTLP